MISQRNYKGKTVDGATADWNPAEGKAMLARFTHVAASSRYTVYVSERSGWRTWQLSQQVQGFGFGFWQDLGPRREAPFSLMSGDAVVSAV